MTRRRVLFEAWRGRYADNPKAISQYLSRHMPDVQQTWVHTPGLSSPPAGMVTVRRQRPGYFAALATTPVYITNDMSPRMPARRPGALYVQTWHGTPIKKIGFDSLNPGPQFKKYLRRLRRDVLRWDLLLSPSAEITELLRSAFDYSGEVLETGYPRNDALFNATPFRRQQSRAALGIPSGHRVVLYMPTWRDDLIDEAGKPIWSAEFDARHLSRALGGGWVVLSRLHPVVTQHSVDSGEGVLDVTHVPDVTELYLAADALVTDYSSAMFDFAVTGRPIVLHVPDLDDYRDRIRGMYFDLAEMSPGPLTASWEATAVALQESLLATGPDATYRRFRARFLSQEDGRASQRVVERLFLR